MHFTENYRTILHASLNTEPSYHAVLWTFTFSSSKYSCRQLYLKKKFYLKSLSSQKALISDWQLRLLLVWKSKVYYKCQLSSPKPCSGLYLGSLILFTGYPRCSCLLKEKRKRRLGSWCHLHLFLLRFRQLASGIIVTPSHLLQVMGTPCLASAGDWWWVNMIPGSHPGLLPGVPEPLRLLKIQFC